MRRTKQRNQIRRRKNERRKAKAKKNISRTSPKPLVKNEEPFLSHLCSCEDPQKHKQGEASLRKSRRRKECFCNEMLIALEEDRPWVGDPCSCMEVVPRDATEEMLQKYQEAHGHAISPEMWKNARIYAALEGVWFSDPC